MCLKSLTKSIEKGYNINKKRGGNMGSLFGGCASVILGGGVGGLLLAVGAVVAITLAKKK